MICIELNHLRSFDLWLVCLSKDVTGTLRNPSASLFSDSFSFCVSVQRRDRCTVSLLRSLLHLYSVSVLRRDRSLFYHCTAQLKYSLSIFRGSALSLLICFLATFHFLLHSVSVQRRGRCSVSSLRFRSLINFYLLVFCSFLHAFACFRILQCYLLQFLYFSYLFWFHSVSVQRRDRCIVTYSPYSGPFTDPLRFGCSLSLFPSFSPSPPPSLA